MLDEMRNASMSADNYAHRQDNIDEYFVKKAVFTKYCNLFQFHRYSSDRRVLVSLSRQLLISLCLLEMAAKRLER